MSLLFLESLFAEEIFGLASRACVVGLLGSDSRKSCGFPFKRYPKPVAGNWYGFDCHSGS